MKVLSKSDMQWIIEHMQGYFRSVIDVVEQREHSSYLVQSIRVKIEEEASYHDDVDLGVTDMYDYSSMLKRIVGTEEFGGFTNPNSTRNRIQWDLELSNYDAQSVSGSDWSFSAASRRLRHISGAMSSLEHQNSSVSKVASLTLRLHTFPLWSEIVQDMTDVVEQLEQFSTQQHWRESDMYTLSDWFGKYAAIFGMALVHETTQDMEYDHDVPYAWQQSMVDGEVVARYRHHAGMFRELLYTVGLFAPITEKTPEYRTLLWESVPMHAEGSSLV